ESESPARSLRPSGRSPRGPETARQDSAAGTLRDQRSGPNAGPGLPIVDGSRAHGLRARIGVLPWYRGPTLCERRFPMITRSWSKKLFARTPSPVRKAQARFRPRLEGLEDRTVPSTFTPTTFADGGAGSGSLRAAIIAANGDSGTATDTINL